MRTPPDKYGFRDVLANVLMTPCMIGWFVVGLILTASIPASVAIGIVMGLPFAFGVAWALFIAGCAAVGWLDKRFGEDQRI
jgi:hypothetical protein